MSVVRGGGVRCPSCRCEFPEEIISLHCPHPAALPVSESDTKSATPGTLVKAGTSKNNHKPKNQKLHRRLIREISELIRYAAHHEEEEPWVSVNFDSKGRQAIVTFRGPPNSLYAGGTFRVLVIFNSQHPHVAPAVKFLHQIFHPNISLDGQIIDAAILKSRWSPTLTLTPIICFIRDMMCCTSLTLHGPVCPCDGPAGEVRGGLTRVVSGRKQVWLVGYQCGGLWLSSPDMAKQITVAHTLKFAKHSLNWETYEE